MSGRVFIQGTGGGGLKPNTEKRKVSLASGIEVKKGDILYGVHKVKTDQLSLSGAPDNNILKFLTRKCCINCSSNGEYICTQVSHPNSQALHGIYIYKRNQINKTEYNYIGRVLFPSHTLLDAVYNFCITNNGDLITNSISGSSCILKNYFYSESATDNYIAGNSYTSNGAPRSVAQLIFYDNVNKRIFYIAGSDLCWTPYTETTRTIGQTRTYAINSNIGSSTSIYSSVNKYGDFFITGYGGTYNGSIGAYTASNAYNGVWSSNAYSRGPALITMNQGYKSLTGDYSVAIKGTTYQGLHTTSAYEKYTDGGLILIRFGDNNLSKNTYFEISDLNTDELITTFHYAGYITVRDYSGKEIETFQISDVASNKSDNPVICIGKINDKANSALIGFYTKSTPYYNNLFHVFADVVYTNDKMGINDKLVINTAIAAANGSDTVDAFVTFEDQN